jgi:hypothetical protein
LEFWTEVRDALKSTKEVPSLQTPRPQYWYDVAIGRSNFVLSCIANTYDNRIGVRLYMGHRVANRAVDLLQQQKEQIEKEIGESLTWNPRPDKMDKTIVLHHTADLENRAKWPEYVGWMVNTVIRFRKAFRDRVKNLDLSVPTDDEKEA